MSVDVSKRAIGGFFVRVVDQSWWITAINHWEPLFMRTLVTILASAILSSGVVDISHAQEISLPINVIDGAPIPVSVAGLPADTPVRIDARRVEGNGAVFASHAIYRSNSTGRIDPALAAPISGDYAGANAAGLFFSMQPDGTAAQDRGTITLTASINGRVVATRNTALIDAASRVMVQDIAAFSGARLFRPKGVDRVPVVIILGGSEGGSGYGRSLGPQLALLGYAAIALPYYNPGWTNEDLPGLPVAFTDVPVDRLAAVHRWIRSRTDLDAGRIGLVGVSKGGEFAMIAATRFPWLRAVVGIVPSDVVWEGWGTKAVDGTSSSFAWNSRSLPFTPYRGMTETIAALSKGERRSLAVPHLEGRRGAPKRTAAARIPVERYRGAMFIAGGDLDRTWPSGAMVQSIAERRAESGRPTVAMSFAGAGHGLAGTGWEPMNYPGDETLVADAEARQVIWLHMREFLRNAFTSRRSGIENTRTASAR